MGIVRAWLPILMIVGSFDVYAACREAQKHCLRSCLTQISAHGQSIHSTRTDFWVQCELACLDGVKECDPYEATTSPADCKKFQERCEYNCPDYAYVYANMQGIPTGYTKRTNATQVCKRACEAGYEVCK